MKCATKEVRKQLNGGDGVLAGRIATVRARSRYWLFCAALFAMVLLALPQTVLAANSRTFATFNTGTITGGGVAFTRSLDVSGLPASEYLMYSVSADYVPGTAPNDAYSSTMQMELNNGGGTVFKEATTANIGVLPAGGSTALRWTGIMTRTYGGGGPLTIRFADPFTDASGPYTSSLSNVVVTIYPAPLPIKSFATFNTGTITGGGAAFSRSLDVSGLPNAEYLMYSVSADYVPGTAPNDGYSNTMQMELNNGGATVFKEATTANIGVLPAGGSTALRWTGIMTRTYGGGGPLTIRFADPFTDANGPYTSSLNNVVVTIYPAPLPIKSFATFNTGTITGGGAAFIRSLDVSGLPNAEYLMYSVSADYVPGTAPNDGYSSTMQMELNNGGATVFKEATTANIGVLPAGGSTALRWTGIMTRTYGGGGTLTIRFADPFTDASGPYTSSLNNVVVTIYPAESVSSTISGNAGVAGATLSYTDGTAKTVTADGTGAYVFSVPYNWSGVVTPSKSGVTFSPASRSYTNITADLASQNYTANSAPILAVNTGLNLNQNASETTITNSMLRATDAEQTASSLVYTIHTLPTWGALLLDGITILTVADIFSQGDIDNNRISYSIPPGTPSGAYSFNVSVSDGAGGNIDSVTFSITIPVPESDLAITMTNGVSSALPGSSVVYTITVNNAGPSAVTGATMTDTLPVVLNDVTWSCSFAGSGSSGTNSGSGNISQAINLSVGGSATCTVSASIAATATGSLSNTATIAPPVGTLDPVPANNNATDSDLLTPTADLSVSVTDGMNTATPGSLVTYTIWVSNTGPSVANGASLVDIFPAELTDVSWTCAYEGSGSSGAPSGSGDINQTINLAAGGSATYTVSGTIALTATGTVLNTVTVMPLVGTTDPNPANNSAMDTDIIISTATLTVTIVGNGSVNSQSAAGSNYACNGGTCQPVTFSVGDVVTLTATGSNSTFTVWDGDYISSSNPGSITMNGDKSVSATFTPDPARVMIEGDATWYYALGTVLNIPNQDATIRARDMDFSENIVHTNLHAITLRGGFSDPGFGDNSQSGFSMVSGSLRIQAGTLRVQHVKVRP